MATHGTGARVETRLYLEGYYMPDALVSITCTGKTEQPATAQIELVPTNVIKNILPGTWVHVFTTDPWDPEPSGDLGDLKLLFEGVVITRGFTRQDDARNFVIQCAHPSIYWTSARQYWLNVQSADGTIVDQFAVQTSGGYGRFAKLGSSPAFGYVAREAALTESFGEDRFLDTMIAVIDDIGNVGPFYTNVRNRFRITDRIVRGPAGNTDKLFQLSLLSDFLDALAGAASGQSNLAQLVNMLLSAVYHEWVSVVAPPYVQSTIFDRDVFGNLKRKSTTAKGKGPRGRKKSRLYRYETVDDMIVADTIFKPHVYTISPPSFNVLFPNMYDNFSYMENFMAETTRVSMKPQLPTVSRSGGLDLTSGVLFQRPTELEVFTSIVRDSARKTSKKRTPDGKYADGTSQAPTFTDYDWMTNEERFRGIVYNFINLAPAPSTLTLTDPGKKTPQGAREGGVPKYLQNVASYEYYKSKFMGRQASVSGPYNMRAVAGFPIVVLDDSDAEMNVVAYLSEVTHRIHANGVATTTYGLQYSRVVGEADLNRPAYKTDLDSSGELNIDLFREEGGNYSFNVLFDGENQPPVPEWFDESFRNVADLHLRYQGWFGPDAGVIQKVFAIDSGQTVRDGVAEGVEVGVGAPSEDASTVGSLVDTSPDPEAAEATLEQLEGIEVFQAVIELNSRYRTWRANGREFEESARFTNRSFTKIGEAFRFVGAGPIELADRVAGSNGQEGRFSFEREPAESRGINYKTASLGRFVGDTSRGSGFGAVRESGRVEAADGSSTSTDGETATVDSVPSGRMSGAFPVFDTEIHRGDEATDPSARSSLLKDPDKRSPSDRARYDGRPLMYDFEFRLWQESLAQAGLGPDGKDLEDNSGQGNFTISSDGSVREKTAEEKKDAAVEKKQKRDEQEDRSLRRERQGKHVPRGDRGQSMEPNEQAPTGDNAESNQRKALVQPLSEKQVVDLRRAVVEAYQEELAATRGFTG